MNNMCAWFWIGVALSPFVPASGATATLQGLGDLSGGAFQSLAYGLSRDGTTAVGAGSTGAGNESFRWTAGSGMQSLGNFPGGGRTTQAWSASDAGAGVVVGYGTSPNGTEAYRCTSASGVQGLGDFAGGSFFSQANDVTPDGSTIVGFGTTSSGGEAFRWTSATGMQSLGLLPGSTATNAKAISSDGATIVGNASDPSLGQAFRWTSATGMQGLGQLGPSGFGSVAWSVNGDGSVIVGQANSNQAFRWTAAGGMQGLGDLAGGPFSSSAHDVSDDGLTVVGIGQTASSFKAFLWTPAAGMRSLEEVLVNDYGVSLGGWQLTDAWGISGNGTVITGHGVNPSGQSEAWIVQLPEPTSATTAVVIGTVALRSLRRRRHPRRATNRPTGA